MQGVGPPVHGCSYRPPSSLPPAPEGRSSGRRAVIGPAACLFGVQDARSAGMLSSGGSGQAKERMEGIELWWRGRRLAR